MNVYKEMSSNHTQDVLERLRNGKVAIAGLGGLGSNIAAMLARSCIGTLLLVDHDTVEASNLNRQFYFPDDVGKKKTDALADHIKRLNPNVCVQIKDVFVTESNAPSIFNGYDAVCEAFDDPISKSALVNSILSTYPDVSVVAASGMAGYGPSNDIRTERKMKRLFVCGDGTSDCAHMTAPRVQICAGHQANAVMRILAGMEDDTWTD